MPEIYCPKCGIRGNSKCPHCRSVFPASHPRDVIAATAQDYFEMFLSVATSDQRPADDGSRRYSVGFWHFAHSKDEAIESVLTSLKGYLPHVNIKVAACVHDWRIFPGQKSEIGCGHEGDPGAVVPDDPFAPVVFKPGDTVRITIRAKARPIDATVTSAINWGTDDDPDWYIETSNPTGYWKQKLDGGTIELVK